MTTATTSSKKRSANSKTPRARMQDEDGQTMAEYSVILGLTVLIAFGAYAAFGKAVLGLYENAVALWP